MNKRKLSFEQESAAVINIDGCVNTALTPSSITTSSNTNTIGFGLFSTISQRYQSLVQPLETLCSIASQISDHVHLSTSPVTHHSTASAGSPMIPPIHITLGTNKPTSSPAVDLSHVTSFLSEDKISSEAPQQPSAAPEIFLPRSFNGIKNFQQTHSSNKSDVSSSIEQDTEDLQNYQTLLKLSKRRTLRHSSETQAHYQRFYKIFSELTNSHDVNKVLDFFKENAGNEVKVLLKFWDRKKDSMSLSSWYQNESMTTINQHPFHNHMNTPNNTSNNGSNHSNVCKNTKNPFGIRDHIEITPTISDSTYSKLNEFRNVVQMICDSMPDSIFSYLDNPRVIKSPNDSNDSIIRTVAPFCHIGTVIMYSTLQELQQHANTLWINPTNYYHALLAAGVETIMHYLPIPIAICVDVQLEGYQIVHFHCDTMKVTQLEIHYFEDINSKFSSTLDNMTVTFSKLQSH